MPDPRDDGGPAFPNSESAIGLANIGMSLRDYFAGQCYSVSLITGEDGRTIEEDFDGAARDAYRRADAMLEARKR